jgi:hypothetical protein
MGSNHSQTKNTRNVHPSIVRCKLQTNSDSLPINVLIDTGSLQASYMSAAVTAWISAITPPLVTERKQQSVVPLMVVAWIHL